MKDEDNIFWLKVVSILTVGVVCIIMTFVVFDYIKDTKMATLGYQRQPVLGYQYPVWQKSCSHD